MNKLVKLRYIGDENFQPFNREMSLIILAGVKKHKPLHVVADDFEGLTEENIYYWMDIEPSFRTAYENALITSKSSMINEYIAELHKPEPDRVVLKGWLDLMKLLGVDKDMQKNESTSKPQVRVPFLEGVQIGKRADYTPTFPPDESDTGGSEKNIASLEEQSQWQTPETVEFNVVEDTSNGK